MKFPALVAALTCLLVAAPAAAAALPDLRPASVSAVHQGSVELSAVVGNAGRARAKASTVRWWLGQTRVGQRRVNALARGRRVRATARVAAPGPGEYQLAGFSAAESTILELGIEGAHLSATRFAAVRGVQGLGNGIFMSELASAEAAWAADMAAAQAARSAAMAAGAKVAGSFAAGLAVGLAFNRIWDCAAGKSFGESVYDWAARQGWVPE